MNIERIETPALIVDVNILKKNAEAMKKILNGTSLALRPHYKSHKCAAIAKWQITDGAIGMTCAKLSEARDLADCGVEDILIANQITDPRKIAAVAHLAGDCRLTVCVDNADNVLALAKAARSAGTTVHCLVEYDIGMERCGVKTAGEVVTLAKLISAEDGLTFDGVQAYAGHLSHEINEAERVARTAENYTKLYSLLDELASHGVPATTVSGGSTGTAEIKAREGLYTELQPYGVRVTCLIPAAAATGFQKASGIDNVNNILALRGDRPKDMTDEQFYSREFAHASDMIHYLKEHTDMHIAGACYPEKHFESFSMESDLKHLKEKQDAGADMLITQLFFDNDYFYTFREKAEKKGITIPIHAGIMPITTAKQIGTTVSLSGSSVPKAMADMIAKYADSPEDMRNAGIDYAIRQIQDLLLNDVDGVHIYTMNKPKMAGEIMEAIR